MSLKLYEEQKSDMLET